MFLFTFLFPLYLFLSRCRIRLHHNIARYILYVHTSPPTPLSHSLIPIRSDFWPLLMNHPCFFFICYNYLWTVWCLGTWYLPSHWYLSMGLNDFVVFSFFFSVAVVVTPICWYSLSYGPPLLFFARLFALSRLLSASLFMAFNHIFSIPLLLPIWIHANPSKDKFTPLPF